MGAGSPRFEDNPVNQLSSQLFRRIFSKTYMLLLFSLFIGIIATLQPSHAQISTPTDSHMPTLTDRVVDNAQLLDAATEAALVEKLAAFQQQSSDQVVVVTVPSLSGEDIESFSNRLFRAWALGQKQEDNGVLLIIAPNERRVRIEVGYGLEGIMTDALSSVIIQSIILPAFRDGNYSAGITDGVDGILSVLSGDADELKDRAERNANASVNSDTDWLEVVFIAFWIVIFFGGFGFAFLAPVFGRKIAPGRYEWLGVIIETQRGGSPSGSRGGRGGGWSSGGGRSSGGGFSGGGGSSGGGGASGSW